LQSAAVCPVPAPIWRGILALTAAAALATSASAQAGNIHSISFYTVKPDRLAQILKRRKS
jgi:hypothetical protein